MSDTSVSHDHSLVSQTTINEDEAHSPSKELALWTDSDSVAPAQQAMAVDLSHDLHSRVETVVEENKGVVLWNEESTVAEWPRPTRWSKGANSSPTFVHLGEVISQDLVLWDGNEPTTLSLSTIQRTLDPASAQPLELESRHPERLEDEAANLLNLPFLTLDQQSEVQAGVREESILDFEDETMPSSHEEASAVSEVVVREDEGMIEDSSQVFPVETLSSAVFGSPSSPAEEPSRPEESQVMESKLDSVPAPNVSDAQDRNVRAFQLSPFWLLTSSLLFVGFIIFSSTWFAQPAQSSPGESQAATNYSRPSNPVVSNASTNSSPVIEQSTVAPLPSPAASDDEPGNEKESARTNDAAPTEKAEESAPIAAPPAVAESTAPQASGGFTTQVSSSQNIEDSNRRAEDLKAAGFPARVVKVEVPKRGIWYRVQVGLFVTRKEAEAFATLLKSKGAAPGLIVTEAQ